MINHEINPSANELILTFECDAISTTVDRLELELENLFDTSSIWEGDWDKLTLNIRKMQMIDSLGLNLLVALIKRAKNRNAMISAKLTSRIIYQTLLATRMDKQMKLLLEE